MRRIVLPVLVLSALAATPAAAWPFGAKPAAPAPAPQAAAAKPASTGQAASGQAALPATDAFHKATPAEMQAALRADPLNQAAFFANQFDHDPTDAQAGIGLSNAQRALGRFQEAADTAHAVLLFSPDNADALLAAARAHIAGNQAFYAIDSLKHLAQLKPADWQPWSLLGVAYDQTKRPEDAQAAWATALKLSPNNPAVLTNMAMARVSIGDFASAEPLLRTAIVQPGATVQVRQNLALVLGLEGKMAEAEHLLRQDLPPEVADANLAWLQQSVQSHAAGTPVADTAAAPSRSWTSLKATGG